MKPIRGWLLVFIVLGILTLIMNLPRALTPELSLTGLIPTTSWLFLFTLLILIFRRKELRLLQNLTRINVYLVLATSFYNFATTDFGIFSSIMMFGLPVILAIAWMFYFQKSKRVKKTFTN